MTSRHRRYQFLASTGALTTMMLLSSCALIPMFDEPSADESSDPSAPASASSGDPVTSLDTVESAVVRIVAEGTFIDPEQGEVANAAGSGSGFIISADGVAVTNNHVVTGAALLDVYVSGEEEPRNARVLGVSECSDVAVIDIEGDGFSSLEWSDDVPGVGAEVYAAGYPLGESEFTLTKGIVSRASTVGETNWASVDSVLLHDATINPGNSGGPLVDTGGRVVGVNYAGDSEVAQFFAISGDEAQPLIEDLRTEADATSIGINGQAFVLDDGTSGIWVASVESGSPADATGLEAGDIITRLENLIVGVDGTMSDYCDILRSNTADDVLAVEVLRLTSGELFAGQINGEELELTQTFSNELAGRVATDTAEGDTYGEYTTIQDDSGAIVVDVPVEWSDVNGSAFPVDATTSWPALQASPDLAAFDAGFTTPGALITASSDLAIVTPDQVLDAFGTEVVGTECTPTGRQPYDDGLYAGSYDFYEACGGGQTVIVLLAAKPVDGSFMVIVAVQANTERDIAALDRIIDTFQVVGTV